MLKIRYAKNTYGPKCQNTHGPKVWLLDTWAWVGAGGGGGGGAAMGQALGPDHGPMPMCPGAKALAHEYFHIWAHKYF